MRSMNYLIKKFVIYTELFLIIFQSGSVYAATDHETTLFYVTRLLMIVLPIMIVLINGMYKLKQAIMLFAGLQLAALVNLLLYPAEFIILEYKLILLILFYLLFAYCHQHNLNIMEHMYKLLFFIVVITLLIYIPVGIFKLDIPYTIFEGADSSIAYRNYFGIYFTYSTKMIPRISGFFWEPGVYEIYLNLLLFLYIVLKKRSKLQLFIVLISIILCQSTLGWIIGLVLVGYKIINGKWYNKHSKAILIATISLAVLCIAGSVFVAKKVETNIIGDSYYMRMLDIYSAFKTFAQNPVFGVGYGNVNAFTTISNTLKGSSNGFLSWLYMTGAFGMLVVLYPFIINSVKYQKLTKSLEWWLFTVIVILFNIGEPFYNLPLMAFILAIAYYQLLNPKTLWNQKEKYTYHC